MKKPKLNIDKKLQEKILIPFVFDIDDIKDLYKSGYDGTIGFQYELKNYFVDSVEMAENIIKNKQNEIPKLIRIDPDVIEELERIAKREDRTIPKQANRFLRESIMHYNLMQEGNNTHEIVIDQTEILEQLK
jgi:hypothetical protein